MLSVVSLALFGLPGGWEWIAILIVALLIFGKSLPHVMRNLGRSVADFKKGVKGIGDEVEDVRSEVAEAGAEVEKAAEKES